MIFFFFKFLELFFNIRIIIVEDIAAVVKLWPSIITPLFLFKLVVLFYGHSEYSCTSILLLEFLDRGSVLLGFALKDSLRDVGLDEDSLSLLGHGNMHPVEDPLDFLRVLGLLDQALVEEDFAGVVLDLLESLLGGVAHLDDEGVVLFLQVLNVRLRLLVQVLVLAQVHLRKHYHQRFRLEQGLDVLEQRHLLLNSVATSLRDIDKVEDSCVQVG